MIIRQRHTSALADASARNFECRAMAHLQRAFPQQMREADEQLVRQMIARGIEQASRYGVSDEYDVIRYIDLMVVFGERFDDNPDYPWAKDILSGKLEAQQKMSFICAVALDYARQEAQNERP